MNEMIGYCGLNCETCDAHLATIHNDQALRERTAKAWAALNQAPILPEHINCEGCRTNGVKTVFCEHLCHIRQCALQKGVSSCGICENMAECPTLQQILSHNPDARKNLT